MSQFLPTLKRYFGYTEFRPLQAEIMQSFYDGQDTVVLMPTGGGKSLCYQLPSLHLAGMTIVISPLISLMKDQVDALNASGIAATFLNSSVEGTELRRLMDAARKGEYKLVYMAPERVVLSGIDDWLRACNITALAIDEAHCISAWGHDFRPDYRNLKRLRQTLPDVPVMALTATATPRVRKDIITELELASPQVFVSSFYRDNLHIRVVPKQNELQKILTLLTTHADESCIIYCFSRKNTEELATLLQAQGVAAGAYHAGLEADQRSQVQDDFIHDRVKVVCATTAFGMGIDKANVRLVIHRSFPKTLEGYYQEIGRAGRDGLPSECVLLYSAADKIKLDYFLRQMSDETERKKEAAHIRAVMQYAESRQCRWLQLLRYFGEEATITSCGTCDVCQAATDTVDATELTQKILSTILKTGERFGKTHILKVVHGSKEQKILDRGHETLSVWGIAKDTPTTVLNEVFMQLLARGFIKQNDGEYPTFCVTPAGKQFLIKKATIQLPRVATDLPSLHPSPTTRRRDERTPNQQTAARDRQQAAMSDYETDHACFAVLRTLRKHIADEKGIPAFAVFTDATLNHLAAHKPQTKAAFAATPGVGAKKLETYANVFMEAIREYIKPSNVPDERKR